MVSAAVIMTLATIASASECELKLTTSAYINWNVINASQDIGLYDKIERNHKCKLKITYYPDYLQSLNAYIAGQQEAVTVTNLDHMTAIAPMLGDAVVVQDYSNGNDGLISRNGKTLQDIKGQEVWMVTKSISELLFIEAAKAKGMDPYKDFKIKHMDLDSNLRAGYDAGKIDNIVTWNPALGYLVGQTKYKKTVVDSSSFPGLIIDQIVLNPKVDDYTIKADLLRDIWDATATLINKKSGSQYSNFITALAEDMGSTKAEAKDMLKSSKIFTPEEEIAFIGNSMYTLQNQIFKIARENEFFVNDAPLNFSIDGAQGGDEVNGAPRVRVVVD